MTPILPASNRDASPNEIEWPNSPAAVTKRFQQEGLQLWRTYLNEWEFHLEDESQGILGQVVDGIHDVLSLKNPSQVQREKIAIDRQLLSELSLRLTQEPDILSAMKTISLEGHQNIRARAKEILSSQVLLQKNGDPIPTLIRLLSSPSINETLARKFLDEAYQLELHGNAEVFPGEVYAFLLKPASSIELKKFAYRGVRAVNGKSDLARSTAKAIHGTSPEALGFGMASTAVSFGMGVLAERITQKTLQNAFQDLLKPGSRSQGAVGSLIRFFSGSSHVAASAATMTAIQSAERGMMHDPYSVDGDFLGRQFLTNGAMFGIMPTVSQHGHLASLAFMNAFNLFMVAVGLAPMPVGGGNDVLAKTTVDYFPFVGGMKFSERLVSKAKPPEQERFPFDKAKIQQEKIESEAERDLEANSSPEKTQTLVRDEMNSIFQGLTDMDPVTAGRATERLFAYLKDPDVKEKLEIALATQNPAIRESMAEELNLDLILPYREALLWRYGDDSPETIRRMDFENLARRFVVARALSVYDHPDTDRLLRSTASALSRGKLADCAKSDKSRPRSLA